jgi:hypothetical protein
LRKLESMRADMGSVNPVIAPQMSGLIEGSLKDLDTRLAEAKIAKARRFVRAERELKERVAKLHERLLDHAAGFPPHSRAHPDGGEDRPRAGGPSAAGNRRPTGNAPSGSVFGCPRCPAHGRAASKGCVTHTPSRFAPSPSITPSPSGRDDVVLVHLNHRWCRCACALLRAEIWAQDDVKKLHRVTVRTVPDALIEGPPWSSSRGWSSLAATTIAFTRN